MSQLSSLKIMALKTCRKVIKRGIREGVFILNEANDFVL